MDFNYEEDLELLKTLYGEDSGIFQYIESLSPDKQKEFIQAAIEEEFYW